MESLAFSPIVMNIVGIKLKCLLTDPNQFGYPANGLLVGGI
jgi:hypothetical protein